MEIWEKQDKETALAYEWFCRYRDMGPERSLIKVTQKYAKKPNYKVQLGKWSKAYDWMLRVERYDMHLEERKRGELENEQLMAAREHIQLADRVMELLLLKIACLQKDEMNPTQWKGLAEFAVKTKRDALGIAEKHDLSGAIEVTDTTAIRISNEFMNRTKRLLATRGETDGNVSS